MTLKFVNCKINSVASDINLRVDPKYHIFLNSKSNWNVFENDKKLINLNKIIKEKYKYFDLKNNEEYFGIPTGESYIDQDGLIINHKKVTLEDCPNRIKYEIDKDDIVLSSLRLAKTPSSNFENLKNLKKYIFSNGFYVFRVNKEWNKKFIMYLLRSKKIKKVIDSSIYRGIGISTYKFEDLGKFRVPKININLQNKVVDKIDLIEKKILSLKSDYISDIDIINEVFNEEFNFKTDEYKKLKKINNYQINLKHFSENIDLRNSAKFNRPSGKFILKDLKKNKIKKIKDFISEEIVLGKSVSPKDYYKDGEYIYISMADIKNYNVNKTDAKSVTREYSQNNIKKQVKINDILIARSGEGTIGKVALVNDNSLKGIFSDFIIKISLKQYTPKFAYYYFRSFYFQELIEIHKKGLGNNTNIFPSQIMEFPIIDLSISKQNLINNKIEKKLNEHKELLNNIDLERNKILDLIEKIVTN
jgi:type I restriction enzyme, S subunit